MKRLILVSVMIVCVVLCFSISKAENPETVLQIIDEENIINLMDASGVKAAVIANTEGLRCIRVAHNAPDGSWILQSSPWMGLPIWLNELHSNDEWIELEYDLQEEELFVSICLFPDENGSWYVKRCRIRRQFLKKEKRFRRRVCRPNPLQEPVSDSFPDLAVSARFS